MKISLTKTNKNNFGLFLITLMFTFNFISSNKLKNKSNLKNKNSNDPLMDMSNDYYSNLFSNKNTDNEPELKLFNTLKDLEQIHNSKKISGINFLENKANTLNSLNNNNISYDNFFPNYENYQNNVLNEVLGNHPNQINNENDNFSRMMNNNIDLNQNKNDISFIKKNSYPIFKYGESPIGRPMGAEMIPVIFL